MKCARLSSFLSLLSIAFPLAADNLSAIPPAGWENEMQGNDSGKSTSSYFGSGSKSNQKSSKSQKKVKPKDLFLVEAGAVYLRPYQGGTDFAQLIDISSDFNVTNASSPYGVNKPLDFDYDWGFRGGIGYQCGKSRQTFHATYLYFASDASRSTTSGYNVDPNSTQAVLVNYLPTGNAPLGDILTSAHSHWNLHFNMLDVALGKKYPRTKCLHFEPFIGIKGILLSENQTSSYLQMPGSPLAKLKQKVDFKGIGAMGGLSLDWVMTSWLSFIGSIDGALLYSSIETKRSSNEVLPSLLWTGKSHDIKGTAVLDATFALRGVYCFKKGQFIDLKIGFEEHYIFQTMKHMLFNSDSPTDLSLMGWFATIGAGF